MTDEITVTTQYPTVSLGPLDADLHMDFWNAMTRVREECPVGWTTSMWSLDNPPGQWIINAYGPVMDAATKWETFSSAGGVASIQYPLDLLRLVPVEIDPPMHRDIRRVLQPFFTPAALAANDESIDQVTTELMDACLAVDGPVDFVAEFNAKLPPAVFLGPGFLDSSPDQATTLLDLIDTLLTRPDLALEAAPKLLEWCAELLEARRQAGRRDDLVGAIAHMGLNGAADLEITERERLETLNLVVMAGMETTMGGLGAVTWLLATDHEMRVRLRAADDRALDRAADEFIRFASPVPTSGRTMTQDAEVGGCPMKEGDRVLVNWAAANLDPTRFPDPQKIDLDRPNIASHVGFGAGIHRCLGSHLAKREIKATIRAVRELARFDLLPGHEVEWRAAFARGPVALPVLLER